MRNFLAFLLVWVLGCDNSINPVSSNIPDQIVVLINGERKNQNIPSLVTNEHLTKTAQAYAELMAEKNELSHSVDGLTLQHRVELNGYQWANLGENIASGYKNAPAVVAGWMNSSGHRQNILNDAFVETGVGVSGKYYCQIFAKPR